MPPNTPGPVQPQQPQQPLPGAPQASVFPSDSQTPVPEALPPAGGNRKRLVLTIFVCLLAVLVISFLAMKAFSHPITKHQVTLAQNAADDFNDDVFKASDAISKAEDAETVADVKSNVDEANSKLAAAQKDMDALQTSEVMRDKDVKAQFDALNQKWKPYLAYLRDSAKDIQAIMPPLISFTDKVDALFRTEPTAATIPSYLAQLKQIIDSSSKQLEDVSLALPEDKDILAAFKADLSASSSAVAKAEADLAAGRPVYVVEDDILGVLDAQTVFGDKIGEITQKLTDKADKLDPGRAYNRLQSALDDLKGRAKN